MEFLVVHNQMRMRLVYLVMVMMKMMMKRVLWRPLVFLVPQDKVRLTVEEDAEDVHPREELEKDVLQEEDVHPREEVEKPLYPRAERERHAKQENPDVK
jgi:hypothetical protein